MSTSQVLTALLAAALAAMSAAPALADDQLVVDDLGVHRGMVAVVARLHSGFDPRTRTSIQSGLPITVRYTVELWRKRRLWFDKQIDSRVRRFRVGYDPGEKLYSLVGEGGRNRAETFTTLDAALERLSPRVLEVHPLDELNPAQSYFVTLEMAIQPLTLEEFRELDGWISGRLRGDSPADSLPDEGGQGVSAAVFDFLMDMAGFGDEVHEAETPPFRPALLEELRIPPGF
jgi:hypothetical protein